MKKIKFRGYLKDSFFKGKEITIHKVDIDEIKDYK